jgi:hypothetical protein
MTGAYQRVGLFASILGNNDDMHTFGLESPTIRGSSLICGIAAILVFSELSLLDVKCAVIRHMLCSLIVLRARLPLTSR